MGWDGMGNDTVPHVTVRYGTLSRESPAQEAPGVWFRWNPNSNRRVNKQDVVLLANNSHYDKPAHAPLEDDEVAKEEEAAIEAENKQMEELKLELSGDSPGLRAPRAPSEHMRILQNTTMYIYISLSLYIYI